MNATLLTQMFTHLDTHLSRMPYWAARIVNEVIAGEAEFQRPMPNNSFYKLVAINLIREFGEPQ